MSSGADKSPPFTVPMLAEAKQAGRKLAMLTAYDAGFARALDANDVDLILIGDSLGMVVMGLGSTLPVTVDAIVYHTRCVARGARRVTVGGVASSGSCRTRHNCCSIWCARWRSAIGVPVSSSTR